MPEDGGLTVRAEWRGMWDEFQRIRAEHTPAQARRFSAGARTLTEVSLQLALQLNKGREWQQAVLADLSQDAEKGCLHQRHPLTYRRLRPGEIGQGGGEGPLLMKEDVDHWLEANDYPCNWPVMPAPTARAADPYPGSFMRQLLVERLGSEAAADAYLIAEASRLPKAQAETSAINVRRSLYVAKYGSEQAADARLADEAKQDALAQARARKAAAEAPAPATKPATAPHPLKLSELIKRHAGQWRSIKRDFKDCKKNGLGVQARAGRPGWYNEQAALAWARQRGKLSVAGHAATVATVHRIKG